MVGRIHSEQRAAGGWHKLVGSARVVCRTGCRGDGLLPVGTASHHRCHHHQRRVRERRGECTLRIRRRLHAVRLQEVWPCTKPAQIMRRLSRTELRGCRTHREPQTSAAATSLCRRLLAVAVPRGLGTRFPQRTVNGPLTDSLTGNGRIPPLAR